jgi:hypothetical protein
MASPPGARYHLADMPVVCLDHRMCVAPGGVRVGARPSHTVSPLVIPR